MNYSLSATISGTREKAKNRSFLCFTYLHKGKYVLDYII